MGAAVEHSTVSELCAGWLAELRLAEVPAEATEGAIRNLTDAAGLCVASRRETCVGDLIEASEDGGCTTLGNGRGLDTASAARVNGVAIHGEDFDDTLEKTPIRVGVAAIPAVLAVGERFGLSGERTLSGIIAGLEPVCHLNHVAAGHMHRAGFHPVSVIGTLGAAAGAGVALDLDRDRLAGALGIAASVSSGIIDGRRLDRAAAPRMAAQEESPRGR